MYHLKFFQMMNLKDFHGDVRKKNDVGRTPVDRMQGKWYFVVGARRKTTCSLSVENTHLNTDYVYYLENTYLGSGKSWVGIGFIACVRCWFLEYFLFT